MPKTPQKSFALTLTETQARVVSRALELQQRVHMGQMEHVAFELDAAGRILYEEDSDDARRDKRQAWERHYLLQTLLRGLNVLVTGEPHPGASLGIRHERVGDDARVSYDIQQVKHHALCQADDRPDKANYVVDADTPYVVDADTPYRTSRREPLPTIVIVPTQEPENPDA